ncbi:hypothetical protein VTK26DRAFT_732 [Humicola hyalothermophila]
MREPRGATSTLLHNDPINHSISSASCGKHGRDAGAAASEVSDRRTKGRKGGWRFERRQSVQLHLHGTHVGMGCVSSSRAESYTVAYVVCRRHGGRRWKAEGMLDCYLGRQKAAASEGAHTC